jgi:hypothetical protein
VLAFAADGPTGAPEEGAGSGSADAGEAVELPAERTASSQTFERTDGSREARIYQAPVNYKDEDGVWRPIEEGLEREGNAFVNGDSSVDLRLPSRMGTAPLRVSIGEDWIAERLLGAATEAGELEGELASYEATNPGTSFDFSTLAHGIEQKITLANPSEPSTLRFELSASNGLEPSKAEDGSIEFKDGKGDVVAVLQPLIMYDSNPDLSAISKAVSYQLAPRVDGTWELTLEASREWLTQPDREWPVVIDPAITGEIPLNEDCTIWGAAAYETWGGFCGSAGYQWDKAFALHSTNENGRALLYFNIDPAHANTAVPKTAYVTGASVNLYAPKAVQNTKGIQLRNVVDTGTGGWASTASWRSAWCYSGTCRPWLNKGGDYGFANWELTTPQRGSQAGWWTFNDGAMIDTVQGWASGQVKNWGLLLKQDNDSMECTGIGPACTDRLAEFASSAYSEANKRPYLSIAYWPQAPATSKLASPKTARRPPVA